MNREKEFYFFLSKNLKEIKIIVENIIFETNGCGILFGEKKTGKTAFVNYLSKVHSDKREFIYFDAESIDFTKISSIKDSIVVIDNAHLLKKEQVNLLKDLCKTNFVIFVIDKEFLVILKEYLKDVDVKFSLEIKPISYREFELLFEQYIKSSDKPIQKNKEIIKYLYELTGGKLGEIFESLDKLNDLVYYFSLKISYAQKVKYLKIFLIFLVLLSGYLTFLIYSITKSERLDEIKTLPVVEEIKKQISFFVGKNAPIVQEEKYQQIKIDRSVIKTPDLSSTLQKEHTKDLIEKIAPDEKKVKDKKLSDSKREISKTEKKEIYQQNVASKNLNEENSVSSSSKEDLSQKSIKKAVVIASVLNVREKPSLDSQVLFKLNRFEEIDVLEKHGEWYKVSKDGKVGWANGKYIKVAEEGYAVVKAYSLNLRNRPSLNSEVLLKLKLGDKVKLTGKKSGIWVEVIYEKDGKKITGWVSSLFLTFNKKPPLKGG